MARVKGGLTALFNVRNIQKSMSEWQEIQERKMILSLQYTGEQFVNKARLTGNYTDRTGNLRSSIGYIILKDGKVVNSNFSGNNDGQSAAMNAANEVAAQFPKGFILIGVAGMEYAAAVEAKNFDVITGSAPTREMMKSLFDGINFGN